ncbi:MAG: hypothetical protein CVV05_11260 [Gammaproteobacteria bacterium HGW-Gammaproteobacteria-1]|jgi:hypothetical protein|nr:MAG: hypothetical protein CVV05_11260 [Gammaproteobacteria bacterium HGW-Gammaproteobacteria-1]
MKKRHVTLLGLILVLAAMFAMSQLKSDELVLSASYQKLACENCYHMTVEKSIDPGLLGETIIPVSKTVDIEKMIDGISLTNEHVCLRGRLHSFNFNLFRIDPDGKKFEVLSQEKAEACASI